MRALQDRQADAPARPRPAGRGAISRRRRPSCARRSMPMPPASTPISRWQGFPLSPEFLLLRFEPEPWRPADSLLWGRIMAWQLSGNAGQEIENEQLRRTVNADLLPLLLREEGRQASLPGLSPTRSASNNWADRRRAHRERRADPCQRSASWPERAGDLVHGAHLDARRRAGRRDRARPAVPGHRQQRPRGLGLHHHAQRHPGPVRGASVAGRARALRHAGGSAPFEVRREIIKVKDGADVVFNVRSTRHGPLISDLDPERYLHRRFALAWTGFMPDDRSPEAFLKMNHAKNAADVQARAARLPYAAAERGVRRHRGQYRLRRRRPRAGAAQHRE